MSSLLCWRGGQQRGGADFYTYRYLATEGFLPGYNFPRLPLYAYVPAAGWAVQRRPICSGPASSPFPSSGRAA